MRRPLRTGRGVAIMTVVALVVFIGRALWANGLFASVPTGFAGSCKTQASVPGIEDMEAAGGKVFVAVASARGPDGRDGIYVFKDGKLSKLAGTPKDFHPRGISIYHGPGGSLYLFAVNRRSNGASAGAGAANDKVRFSIDSFEIAQDGTALTPQGTIEGGLLTDPQDVAAAGPGAFYVSNNSAKSNLTKQLAGYGVLPASEVLYFNGMSFRSVADGLYGARGLVLAPDGTHLLVASLTTRSIKSFDRNVFSGALTEADSLTLAAAPEKLSLDSYGQVWAAGHANLFHWRAFAADPKARDSSQAFRVSLLNGVPQDSSQIYGNDGKEIAAASVAVSSAQGLLIGSSLDQKLLSCRTK
jgi:arylesterase / paraoxonase